MLCEYGCGNKAKYFLKRPKKWCCSKSYNSCPTSRKKNKESHLGEKNHRYRKHCSEETKNKISQSNKGNIPWNKDKTDVYSDETLQLMSDEKKGQIPWNKGVKNCFSKDTTKRISESLKGHIPWNKGRLLSIEEKNNISISTKGKKRSKEFKNKLHKRMTNSGNINWKGGYSKNGVPTYNAYASKLTVDENPERDLLDMNILTVICYTCKKRFIPSLSAVSERVRCLNGTQNGECRLYCSDECKSECSIFNKSLYQVDHPKKKTEIYTQEEYNIWKQSVLGQDNYECQMCGSKENLHCHHIIPVKLEPMFALDPDNGIVLCQECHYKYGHKTGTECSTGNLANKIC